MAITLAICWHSYYGQCCRSDRMGLSPQFSQTFIHRSDQVYSPVGSHSNLRVLFDNIFGGYTISIMQSRVLRVAIDLLATKFVLSNYSSHSIKFTLLLLIPLLKTPQSYIT